VEFVISSVRVIADLLLLSVDWNSGEGRSKERVCGRNCGIIEAGEHSTVFVTF
jgi:hypothetical protein